ERAAANRVDGCLMARVTIEKRDLDEAGAGIDGLGIRNTQPDLRPGAVRPNEHIGRDRRAVGKGDHVPAAIGRDGRDLAAPSDRPGRKRPYQQASKLAPVYFRTNGGVIAGVVKQDVAVLVDDAFGV